MPILVTCWRRRSYIGAPDALAGMPVECPTCRSTVHLPSGGPPAPPTRWETRGRPILAAAAVLLYAAAMCDCLAKGVQREMIHPVFPPGGP